jgi:hypothetical protein
MFRRESGHSLKEEKVEKQQEEREERKYIMRTGDRS